MKAEILVALASFCLVSTITPGPNNMMLLSSGATFGFRRTLPHVFGISSGCVIMVLLLGWGLAGVVGRVPYLYETLHIVSTVYLLWLAWRIATSSGIGGGKSAGRPLRIRDAVGFQWVNPKAWAMVLGAVTSFARPDHILLDVTIVAAVLALVGLPCIMLWAGFGTVLKRALSRPAALRTFNIGMAALLVLSLAPGLWRAATTLLATHPTIG
jgi:threonine/homoserine/homoserine lactone efflux protein